LICPHVPAPIKETVGYIKNFAQALRLSLGTCDKAIVLLHRFYDAQRTLNQRMPANRYVVSTCCLYYSCKMMGHSRSIKELARACAVSEKGCVAMMKQFKHALPDIPALYITVHATDLLVRALQQLEFGTRFVYNRVLRTCHTVHADIKDRLEGKTPECICGICIHCACIVHGINHPLKQIASVCMVSQNTLLKSIPLVAFNKDKYVLINHNEMHQATTI